MTAALITIMLLMSANAEQEGAEKGATQLLRASTATTTSATSSGRSLRLTLGQPLASSVLTGPGYEVTLGARRRIEALGDGIFASGFEDSE
ncbi:MAG: hypothetical protein AB8B96_22435 [Lysobacterales bacterium]